MTRRLRLWLLAALTLGAAGVASAQEDAGPPPAGVWKLTLPTLEETQGSPLVLLKFEKDKAGKWEGTVVSAVAKYKHLEKVEVTNVSVTEKAWKFALKGTKQTMNLDLNLGKDLKAKAFFGEMRDRGEVMPAEMERTTMAALDVFEILRESIATEPLGMRAAHMARMLLSQAEKRKVKAADVRQWASKGVKSAALYGPTTLRTEQLYIAEALADQAGYEKTALEYATLAEAGLDEKAEGPVATKRVLDVLAAVQEKAGKKDDAAQTQLRIKRLTFPIKTNKYAGRKAKSDRVVLAELFTTAQAGSVVPAEAAMRALGKTFDGKELAVLLYHEHFPVGDPLGSPESEDRLRYYAGDVRKLPTLILNGRVVVQGGGGPEDGQDHYESYRERVEEQLEAEAQGGLTLKAGRKGDKVSVTVGGKLAEASPKARLRVALVERETTYKGKSGVSGHFNVVRAMAGGAAGTAVKGKALDETVTFDLADLKKKLEKYQAEVNENRPFPDKERPLELKELRVVAFVQNDETKEVLQAALVDLD